MFRGPISDVRTTISIATDITMLLISLQHVLTLIKKLQPNEICFWNSSGNFKRFDFHKNFTNSKLLLHYNKQVIVLKGFKLEEKSKKLYIYFIFDEHTDICFILVVKFSRQWEKILKFKCNFWSCISAEHTNAFFVFIWDRYNWK